MNLPFPVPYEDIAALLPYYSEAGDLSQILTIGGQTVHCPVGLRALIRKLARSCATDLAALRHQTRQITNHSILQPIPLSSQVLLFPAKIRHPRIAGDRCTGYINLYAVRNVTSERKQACPTMISLQGGTTVPVLWTEATVRRHMQSAKLTALSLTPGKGRQALPGASESPELARIAQQLVEVLHSLIRLGKNSDAAY